MYGPASPPWNSNSIIPDDCLVQTCVDKHVFSATPFFRRRKLKLYLGWCVLAGGLDWGVSKGAWERIGLRGAGSPSTWMCLEHSWSTTLVHVSSSQAYQTGCAANPFSPACWGLGSVSVSAPIRRYADRFVCADAPLRRSLCLRRYAVTPTNQTLNKP